MKKFEKTEGSDFEMELEYYLTELRSSFGSVFDEDEEDRFRESAAEFYRQDQDLFDLAIDTFGTLKRKQDLQLELQELRGLETDSLVREKLNEHVLDRSILEERNFEKRGEKSEGFSTGYIANQIGIEDGPRFMIKKAIIESPPSSRSLRGYMTKHGINIKQISKISTERRNFINEYMVADLYTRGLPGRSPQIVGLHSSDGKIMSFRSKFLNPFQTVAEFTGGKGVYLGESSGALRDVKGVEKVFATMLAWGENDINAGNLGVVVREDAICLAKIDHGYSGTRFFTTAEKMLNSFAFRYQEYGYQDRLKLNAGSLVDAINEITMISDEEIEKLIKARSYKLRDMVGELDVTLEFWEDYEGIAEQERCKITACSNFEELENFYIERFQNQMQVMRELAGRLAIISKIDRYPGDRESTTEWLNGQWLQDVRGMDPILYAIGERLTIDGKDPIVYAVKNRLTIDGRDPIEYARENSLMIDGQDPDSWVMRQNPLSIMD